MTAASKSWSTGMKNFIANGRLPERDGICFDWMTNYTINIHICQILLENVLIFMRTLHKYRLAEMFRNGKNASDLLVETMRRKHTNLKMEKLEAALHRPAFPLFLGRRSCPPTLPLSLGLRELPLEDALRNEPWKVSAEYQERWQRKHPGQTLHLRMLLDANTEAASIAQVRDVPLSYDPAWRRYSLHQYYGRISR